MSLGIILIRLMLTNRDNGKFSHAFSLPFTSSKTGTRFKERKSEAWEETITSRYLKVSTHCKGVCMGTVVLAAWSIENSRDMDQLTMGSVNVAKKRCVGPQPLVKWLKQIMPEREGSPV